ncbi:DUF4139 domain-containing protein [uncultured Sphingomonas sp.]|uniref:DUF4139 domain-containing protein n=1 Tax=uncultured Sphingomonas sp. TaxID=158754 RepID=UPI0035CC8DB3
MTARRLCLGLALALAPAPAVAQDRVVTSPAASDVALTVYRAPYGKGAIDLQSLGGFALVTETRRVRLPRGASVLRFEGVAEGIVPVSAVIDGLPGGVIEKNRDARLLSPASLVDGTLGRQVTLTRTDRATGRAVSEEATIVAGPEPGIVLRTSAGIETLRCAGLPERLTFDGVPAGLSSKPVLSVATVSPVARTVTLRLSYLASGFDWRASYVATVAADDRSLDLFAWLTLANGNPEAFADAQVNAVAGRLNRVFTPALQAAAGALSLRCYPLGTTTSDLRTTRFREADEIVVTAARMMASPMEMAMMPAPPPPPPPPPPPVAEDLGDLKLYRVPDRVTVSALGQKQVALLARGKVRFERRYRRSIYPGQTIAAAPTAIVLVLRNRKEDALGLALPSGSTATYARRGDEQLLLGLGDLDDRAEGETFRIAAGVSTQVMIEQVAAEKNLGIVTATNASRSPVTLEVPIGAAGQKITSDDEALAPIDGVATWSAIIAPGARAELRYRYE